MKNAAGGYIFEALTIGQNYEFEEVITREHVNLFAEASMDTNPLHLDEEFAKSTRFEACIAHGMLSASLISAAIGMHLPGPGTVYVSQVLQFRRPVYINSKVKIKVEITALNPEKKLVTLSTNAFVNDKAVLTGEAVVLVPEVF